MQCSEHLQRQAGWTVSSTQQHSAALVSAVGSGEQVPDTAIWPVSDSQQCRCSNSPTPSSRSLWIVHRERQAQGRRVRSGTLPKELTGISCSMPWWECQHEPAVAKTGSYLCTHLIPFPPYLLAPFLIGQGLSILGQTICFTQMLVLISSKNHL